MGLFNMKLIELFEDIIIKETATAGSTSSGNIASVAFGLGSGFSDEYWRSVYSHKEEKRKNKEKTKKKEKNQGMVTLKR